MSIGQALQARVESLCREKGIPAPSPDIFGEDTTISEIEVLCAKLQISLVEFFASDIFRK